MGKNKYAMADCFYNFPKSQVYWECVNTRRRKFFKQMWNLSSWWGAASLIKQSVENQLKCCQDVRNVNRFLLKANKARRKHLTIQLLWVTARLLVTHFIVLSTQWMKEMRCEFSPLPGVSARIWNLEDWN